MAAVAQLASELYKGKRRMPTARSTVLILTIGLVAVTRPVPAGSDRQMKDDLLSVQETLELIPKSYHTDPKSYYKRCKRADPAARAQMYRMLTDPQPPYPPPCIAQFFGYVGKQEDVSKLCELIRSHRGVLDLTEKGVVISTLGALAIMSSRKIPGAADTMQRMMQPGYWSDVKFRLVPKHKAGTLRFENEMAYRALLQYAWSLDPAIEAKARALVARTDDPEQKRLMEARRSGVIAVYRNLCHRVERVGSWLGDASETTRLSQPAARTTTQPTVRADGVARLVDEAVEAYETARAAMMSDRYETLAKMLAHEGEPLLPPEEQTDQALDRLVKQLRGPAMGASKTKALLEALAKCKTAYGPAQVEWRSKITVREKARNAGRYEAFDRNERVVVQLPLLGSEAVAERHVPTVRGDCRRTIDPATRQFIAYMIRENGQWFWNAFLW